MKPTGLSIQEVIKGIYESQDRYNDEHERSSDWHTFDEWLFEKKLFKNNKAGQLAEEIANLQVKFVPLGRVNGDNWNYYVSLANKIRQLNEIKKEYIRKKGLANLKKQYMTDKAVAKMSGDCDK